MRLALQRLLPRQSTVFNLHSAVYPNGAGFCQHCYLSTPTTTKNRRKGRRRKRHKKDSAEEQLIGSRTAAFSIRKFQSTAKDDTNGKGAIVQNRPDIPKAHARLSNAQQLRGVKGPGLFGPAARPGIQMIPVTEHDVHGSNLSLGHQLGLPIKARRSNRAWRSRLVTFEQYQYQSNLEARALREPRLVDDPLNTHDWELWLELIVFRRRHHGPQGTMAIYKEIFRRGLQLPTQGIMADRLWDYLIRAGFYGSGLLEETLIYAIRIKRSSGTFWSKMYYSMVSIALKKDPNSAYSWHLKLKDDFPPSLEDYQKLFKLSLEWGRSAHFRDLYRETPLTGMYSTVIWRFCELQMYAEALKWHDLLFEIGDFPADFTDIKSLLDHLIYIGNKIRVEETVRELSDAKVLISNMAEDFVKRNTVINREIMNRQLGEIHGVAPKHLTDGFCARLFATQLFSVDTVIKGLHMIAAEAIGPLSLREIAVRDNCEPGTICHHVDALRDAGISLGDSVYCTLLRSLAVENKGGVLKSVVDCDLHPDTFADRGLQERLLVQYIADHDLMKIERTFAILTAGCTVNELQVVRMNLILRCQITLEWREKVLATLGEMKHMGIPVSASSSRHLRVRWLSRRQVGRGAERTEELSILIQASKMTIESGGSVPIISWREILRRLGMAGRLIEFENLALWLVDYYSSPAAKAGLSDRILLSAQENQALVEGHVPLEGKSDRDPQHFLDILFTTSAQHAIVAWGFQHIMKTRSSIRGLRNTPTVKGPPQLQRTPRIRWTWGLNLLYKLRKRGLNVRTDQVAQICRQRLNILFGTGLSKRHINRRARAENFHTKSFYLRKIKEIWGKGLWRPAGRGMGKGIGQRPHEAV